MIKLQAMSLRVFLHSGDDAVKRSLGEQLVARGYLLAGSAPEADLLLLDSTSDAAAPLCAALRGQGCAQPLLLLGLGAEQARAAGADDGLAKPFRFGDLLRRLEQTAARDFLAIGRFRLDPNAREMTGPGGLRLRLTEKEAAMLSFLARAGEVVARESLLGEVWGYSDGATTHTVETHIYRLRRKLTENGAADLLLTEAGGYRLSLTTPGAA
jgi:DNA-binding response OmpR family regulator